MQTELRLISLFDNNYWLDFTSWSILNREKETICESVYRNHIWNMDHRNFLYALDFSFAEDNDCVEQAAGSMETRTMSQKEVLNAIKNGWKSHIKLFYQISYIIKLLPIISLGTIQGFQRKQTQCIFLLILWEYFFIRNFIYVFILYKFHLSDSIKFCVFLV